MTAVQSNISAEAAIFSLLQTLHIELQQKFAAVLWSLWKHLNNKLWHNENEAAAQVISRARNLTEGWVSVNATLTHSSVSHGSRADQQGQFAQANMCVWKKPQRGRFKCNIDADFSSVWNRTGIGVCLRDMKFDNVDFVTNSKVTVNAFNSPRNDLTEFGCIITACRNLFSSHFANSRVEFSRRQANVAAHILTGEAIFSASPVIHFNVPDCIDFFFVVLQSNKAKRNKKKRKKQNTT